MNIRYMFAKLQKNKKKSDRCRYVHMYISVDAISRQCEQNISITSGFSKLSILILTFILFIKIMPSFV